MICLLHGLEEALEGNDMGAQNVASGWLRERHRSALRLDRLEHSARTPVVPVREVRVGPVIQLLAFHRFADFVCRLTGPMRRIGLLAPLFPPRRLLRLEQMTVLR